MADVCNEQVIERFSKKEILTVSALNLVFVLAFLGIMRSNDIHVLLFKILVASTLVIVIDIAYFFFRKYSATFGSRKNLLFLGTVSLLGGITLEVMSILSFPSSSPLVVSDWNKYRLTFFIFISFTLSLIALVWKQKVSNDSWRRIKSFNFFIFTAPGIFGGTVLIAALTGSLPWKTTDNINNYLFIFLTYALLLVGFFYLKMKNSLSLEKIFFVVVLVCGSLVILLSPPITGGSWDDEIHYARANGLSLLGEGEVTQSEVAYVDRSWLGSEGWHLKEIEKAIPELDGMHEASLNKKNTHRVEGFIQVGRGWSLSSITSVGEIPAAVGIWISRFLGLALSWQFIIGKFFNLLVYASIMAIAIKKLPAYKILLASVGLLPTSIFLASNYSVDPWVIAFLSLGFSLFLEEFYDRRKVLTASKTITILAIFLLGMLPKAIYFPMIAVMFFMPSKKFEGFFTKRVFYSSIFLTLGILILSFILPIFFSVADQTGDLRGGAGVNSIEQIRFILSNPVQYSWILIKFLSGYIAPVGSDSYAFNYAYFGQLSHALPMVTAIPFILLMWVTVVAEKGVSNHPIFNYKQRIILFILVVFTISLIATALYVSFTPVSSPNINGVQPRYLLPILFPMMIALFSSSCENKREKGSALLTNVAMLIMVACNATCVAYLLV